MRVQAYGDLLPIFQRIAAPGLGILRGWRAWDDRTIAKIKVTPQVEVILRRLMIPAATGGDWLINDIRIGNASQNSGGGLPIPAAAFAMTDFNNLRAGPTRPITIVVTYIGDDPAGARFIASFLAERSNEIGDDPVNAGRRSVIPCASEGPIRPNKQAGRRVAIQIDDRVWHFQEDRAAGRVLVRDGGGLWLGIADPGAADACRVDLPTYELELCDGTGQRYRGERTPHDDMVEAPVWSEIDIDHPIWTAGMGLPRNKDPGILHPVRPIAVSLHALSIPSPMLFGIDEKTGKVVFEIGIPVPVILSPTAPWPPLDELSGSPGTKWMSTRFERDG